MKISDNIIKEQLKNVYFLCGGAYGGKTTMANLLEEKYGFIDIAKEIIMANMKQSQNQNISLLFAWNEARNIYDGTYHL